MCVCVCVCVVDVVVVVVVVVVIVVVVKEQNINHLKGRDPEKCVCKCEKGLHGQHILHHKYTK